MIEAHSISYVLSFWFLLISLFFPRIGLFMLWMENNIIPLFIPQPEAALVWLFLPRVLILFMIYTTQGLSNWFWIHFVFAAFALLGTITKVNGNSK